MAWQLTALAAIRIATFSAVAPLLGSRHIPWWVRVALVVMVSLALAPLAGGTGLVHSSEWLPAGEWIDRGCSELMLGLMLGLGVAVIVGAASMAGQILAQMSGLAWPTMDSDESPVTCMTAMLTLVVFCMMNGPELMMGTLADTFVTIPAGSSAGATGKMEFVVHLMSHSFWLALRGAGPAIAALWIAMLTVTLIVRTLPSAGCMQMGIDGGLASFWLAMVLLVCGGVWVWMGDIQAWMQDISERLIVASQSTR